VSEVEPDPEFITESGVVLNTEQLLHFTMCMWMRQTKMRDRNSESLRAYLEERSWLVTECRVWWEGSRFETSVQAQLQLWQTTFTVREVP
jgi:hypothetical protein